MELRRSKNCPKWIIYRLSNDSLGRLLGDLAQWISPISPVNCSESRFISWTRPCVILQHIITFTIVVRHRWIRISAKNWSKMDTQRWVKSWLFLWSYYAVQYPSFYYYFTALDQIFASDLLLYYTSSSLLYIAQTLINSFDIVVYMICHRFRAVNKMIKQLDEKVTISWIALKIRRIRKWYNGT